MSIRGRVFRKDLVKNHRFSLLKSTSPLQCTALSDSDENGNANSNKKYNHIEVETKWQNYWDKHNTFKTKRRPNHKKKYVLDMFPYPSGSGLHVGHPEGYTATDIMARYWRMLDYDVLHPMGWDAFGLPAEQHAMNTGTHPKVTTLKNIATFKRQLKSLGFSYDWSRELSTTDEQYFKWTQWIFLQLFKSGLAAQSEVSVNWCPALGTVLANEEVINGLSERGNHPVVRQPLRQWVLKITHFADRLEQDLAGIEWPEGTLVAQKQWIGRSVGAAVQFTTDLHGPIEVFTTRPDTLMGVTYLVLAPEHPLVDKLCSESQREAVQEYVQAVKGKSDLERTATGKDKGKTGVFLGAYAVHPISGDRVPVWTADYVLAGYGTGAVMAVPAHDERDFEFAQIYDLPIKQVVAAANSGEVTLPYAEEGVVCNSGVDFDTLSSSDARNLIIQRLTDKNLGRQQVTYKLRDWVFSRQRYWGEPIPIYFPVEMLTADGGGSPLAGDAHRIVYEKPIAVEESELPLTLPEMTDFHPGDDPQGCLARAKDWRFFQRDGQWFARETNTMPQWAGSCWYYLRFTDPNNSEGILGEEGQSWLPVDLYVGGQEHAVLHLLYARFWHKVLFDLGVVNHKEPFLKLVHQGMILGTDGEKMSKSRGNVINPDDVVKEYGADALRLYEMFMGPLEAVKPWQTNQLLGVVRFRDRVLALMKGTLSNAAPEGQMLKEMHKTIKKVTQDVDRFAFNTAISSLMVYTNFLTSAASSNKGEGLSREAVESLVLLLSPFAPHVAEECWALLGHSESISHASWPQFDEALCVQDIVTIAIQVNGKVRTKMDIQVDAPETEILGMALELPNVKKFTDGNEVKKTIYVPGRILNILV
eukprot:CAMPEP_0170069554 /NCGR_PEP_ID=MMETSP0019_2-20121128/8183_1 /TAXON_ID=98059 /ORGANISM="Dinobryon sp., Strain UTEXLB2267" /LENGTH=868 /DNA_ID=CAMNT_0010277623 /DNA_START=20 /DNA_END=2626 /DNA_ORIENTATION=-